MDVRLTPKNDPQEYRLHPNLVHLQYLIRDVSFLTREARWRAVAGYSSANTSHRWMITMVHAACPVLRRAVVPVVDMDKQVLDVVDGMRFVPARADIPDARRPGRVNLEVATLDPQ